MKRERRLKPQHYSHGQGVVKRIQTVYLANIQGDLIYATVIPEDGAEAGGAAPATAGPKDMESVGPAGVGGPAGGGGPLKGGRAADEGGPDELTGPRPMESVGGGPLGGGPSGPGGVGSDSSGASGASDSSGASGASGLSAPLT